MNAISLLSLHRSDEALKYKILAISNLKGALTQGLDNKSRPQAIATSLLLTLYEVKLFGWLLYVYILLTLVVTTRSSVKVARPMTGRYTSTAA